ncbi:MAG TPA: hypothetical protein VD963_01260 [Phycisphaerales bacterium]|nr:hypothetical protein [Phycisphaerales bacterium]
MRQSARLRSPGELLEHLEGRLLLGADPLPFTYYYPEGFSHDQINEFVSISNPNESAVSFELHARYETGVRDALIESGTIGAGSRGGVTVNRGTLERKVRPDTPYAFVLKSSAPVGALLAHYDFGTAVGEAFTDVTSTQWNWGEGFKDPNWTRDFVLFYNPNDQATLVTLTVYTDDGQTIDLSFGVEGQRRGGFNLNDELGVPTGVFGMKLTAGVPVVAALSHYEIVTQRGFGAVGTAGSGATAGVIPGIEFDNDGDPTNGTGGTNFNSPFNVEMVNGQPTSFPANAYLTVLNTSNQTATVRFTFGNQDRQTLVNPVRTITVAPNSRGGLSVRELGFPLDRRFGVIYTSNAPVTVTAAMYEGRDAVGMQAADSAATRWDFGEGYMDDTRAGAAITEDLYVFNPTAFAMPITIEFFFNDGTVRTIEEELHPVEIRTYSMHQLTEILGHPGTEEFFSIRVTAGTPMVATFEHWDRDLGGGFMSAGTPGGTVVPLHTVLVLN